MSTQKTTSTDTLFRLTLEDLQRPETYSRTETRGGYAYDVDGLGSIVGQVADELVRTGAPGLGAAKEEIRSGQHAELVHEAITALRTETEKEAKKTARKIERRRAVAGTHHGYTVTYSETDDVYYVAGPKDEQVNDGLRALKGRWNPSRAAWCVKGSTQRRLSQLLEQIPQLRAATRQAEAIRQAEEARQEAAKRQAEADEMAEAERQARAVIDPLIGTHGHVGVRYVRLYTRDGSRTYPAVQLRFPKSREANDLARGAGLYWDGEGYSRGLGVFDATALPRVIERINAAIDQERQAEQQAARQSGRDLVIVGTLKVGDYVGYGAERRRITSLGESWYMENDGDSQYLVTGGQTPWADGWRVQYAYWAADPEPQEEADRRLAEARAAQEAEEQREKEAAERRRRIDAAVQAIRTALRSGEYAEPKGELAAEFQADLEGAREIMFRGDRGAAEHWGVALGGASWGGPNLYGSGSWLAVTEQHLYEVRSNSHDGDDWSRSNVRSGLAVRVPRTEAIDEALRLLLRESGQDEDLTPTTPNAESK